MDCNGGSCKQHEFEIYFGSMNLKPRCQALTHSTKNIYSKETLQPQAADKATFQPRKRKKMKISAVCPKKCVINSVLDSV